MALTHEDGTGKADAEAFCDVSFADTYFAARGNATWAALSSDAKEQALRMGCDYMQQTYRLRWLGYRMHSTQALDWPRYDVPRVDYPQNWIETDEVPIEVQRANAELALKSTTEDLLADIGQLKQSVTVGPISTTYANGSLPVKRFLAVDRMLAPLLTGGGGSISVVRC